MRPLSWTSKVLVAILAIYVSPISRSDQPLASYSQFPAELRKSAITAMHTDQYGFLWLGTQNGLYKYDGTRLSLFSSKQSGSRWIRSSDIRSITEDKAGRLFVATYGGGLLHWNQNTDSFKSISRFGNQDILYIKRIFSGYDGDVWIATNNFAIKYNLDNNAALIRRLNHLTGTISSPVFFENSADNAIYIAQSNTITAVNGNNEIIDQFTLESESLAPEFNITAIKALNDSSLLIGTSTGDILVFDSKQKTVSRHAEFHNQSVMITGFLIGERGILTATDNGLYLLDQELNFLHQSKMSSLRLSSNDIYSLYPYGDYVLVGTYNGLNVLTFSPFEIFQVDDDQHKKDTLAFVQDNSDRLWIGTYDGLFIWNDAENRHLRVGSGSILVNSNRLPDQRITALENFQGEIWVGSFGSGVHVVNPYDLSLRPINHPQNSRMSVVDLQADPESKSMWIATYNMGLIRLRSDGIDEYLDGGVLTEPTVTRIYLTSVSDLFVTSLQKIYRYNRSTDEFLELVLDFGLDSERPFINVLKELASGDILFGTRERGLYRWTRSSQILGSEKLDRVGSETVTQTATIYGIEESRNGQIWCSTDTGVFQLQSSGILARIYTVADGLQGDDFTFGASFTDAEERIYFGGPSGYNRFLPTSISERINSPKTLLTSILSPTETYRRNDFAKPIERLFFSHKDYFITFEFSVMDLVASSSTQFRYIVEGFDQDWIDTGHNHSATYTNLPPGEYRFRVQGMNAAGIWDNEGAEIAFSVLPPFWKATWAYAIYVLLLALLGWVAHRVYYSYVVDRRAAAVALQLFETEERADDEMQEQMEYQDQLIQLAYSHKIDTLTLVRSFLPVPEGTAAAAVDPDYVSSSHRRVRVLSILEEHIFYGPNGPSANLYDFVETLIPELIHKADVPVDSVITVNQLPQKLVTCRLASPLAIIIYELVANSLEHAYEVNSLANYLFVELELSSDNEQSELRYQLTVSDSGIGCPKNLFDIAEPGSGIGVVLSIVNAFDGSISMKIDKGTRISVSFPAGE